MNSHNALFHAALCVVCVSAFACSDAGGQNEDVASNSLAMAPPSGDDGDVPAPPEADGGGQDATPPDVGCTLTQGFWKTHPLAWPVDSLTIGGVVYTAKEALDILATSPRGDTSLILAHQLIGAKLNVLAGASEPLNIDDADAWMAANKDADGRLPFGTKSGEAAAKATELGDSLASYNEGSIGPGHCDDGEGPSLGGKASPPKKNQ